MLLQIVSFIIGLLLLYYGAGWLVKGSSSLAKRLGLAPIVIGLTVVAFGTSAPELVVSLVSAVKGKSMIAIGNVVGSNICNIALVLGLTAVFHPVVARKSVICRDIPLMLAVSLYLLLLSLNSTIGRIEGISLFSGVIAYTGFNYWIAIRETRTAACGLSGEDLYIPKQTASVQSMPQQIFFIVLGIGAVIYGADLLVDAAVSIMTVVGVSEKVIGLTVVAFGTSVPELATSIVAVMKKEMDISLGNLVGSNVFNILSVIGATAIVRPIRIEGGFIPSGLLIDYLVMMFISFLPWLLMRKDHTISRKEGLFLLLCYGVYVGYLFFKA